MTTKDQALALALQALEATLETLDNANSDPGGPIADTIWHTEYETLFDYLAERINTLKQAIDTSGQRVEDSADGEHEAAQQQKPVAYIRKDHLQKAVKYPFLCEVTPEPRIDRIGIYTLPPAQQPAMRRATREEKISNPGVYEVPVDTPPPENKPWVGLTPEDIAGAPDNPIALIAYIEAKLREKNGGAA